MIRPLSPGQTKVAECVAQGWTYQQIALHLGLSHHTVKHYVERTSDKLDDSDVEYGISPYRRVQRWMLTISHQELV